MKLATLLFVLALVAPSVAGAEKTQKFGDTEVHYNAMPTDELQPEVAKAYRIDRSKNRALVTISVLKKNNLGVMQPVKAEVKVNAVNMSAQLFGIDVREIQEGTAVYYLGDFRVTGPDTLKFSVTIKPQGETKARKFEFRQKFYD